MRFLLLRSEDWVPKVVVLQVLEEQEQVLEEQEQVLEEQVLEPVELVVRWVLELEQMGCSE